MSPKLVFNTPGWDAELLAELGDRNVSIESSVAVREDTVYFANSRGLVQGWDLSPLRSGSGSGTGSGIGATPTRTFRFWTGGDTDASVVIDDEGMLDVASELDRGNEREAAVGQLVKLDPSKPDDSVVWSVPDTGPPPHVFWATPVLHRDLVVAVSDGGRVIGVDRTTGRVRWERRLPGPTWQSPVVVDDVLVQGDCAGVLHAYDVSDTPVESSELWSVQLEGCIESTPTLWRGGIYVGTRAGWFYALGV